MSPLVIAMVVVVACGLLGPVSANSGLGFAQLNTGVAQGGCLGNPQYITYVQLNLCMTMGTTSSMLTQNANGTLVTNCTYSGLSCQGAGNCWTTTAANGCAGGTAPYYVNSKYIMSPNGNVAWIRWLKQTLTPSCGGTTATYVWPTQTCYPDWTASPLRYITYYSAPVRMCYYSDSACNNQISCPIAAAPIAPAPLNGACVASGQWSDVTPVPASSSTGGNGGGASTGSSYPTTGGSPSQTAGGSSANNGADDDGSSTATSSAARTRSLTPTLLAVDALVAALLALVLCC
jgi:hypothetical protein